MILPDRSTDYRRRIVLVLSASELIVSSVRCVYCANSKSTRHRLPLLITIVSTRMHVNSSANVKPRIELSVLFKNLSASEESSDSELSGEYSNIPLQDSSLPNLDQLNINTIEMEPTEQLKIMNQTIADLQEKIAVLTIQQSQPSIDVASFFRIPDPIKSLPSFDGNRKQLSTWLTTTEETLNLFKDRVTGEVFKMYLTAVINKIEGKARDILCLAGSINDFESLKEILFDAFGDRQELSTYKCKLWQNKMVDGMTIHKYYQKTKEIIQCIKTIAKQTQAYKDNWAVINQFIDEDGLAAFISGLKGMYFGHIQAARPKDIEEAYAFLCKFKSHGITADCMVQKPPNHQKNSFFQNNRTATTQKSHFAQNQNINREPYPQPMEVDNSMRSRLTLNKRTINNFEVASQDDNSANCEQNFHLDSPSTSIT